MIAPTQTVKLGRATGAGSLLAPSRVRGVAGERKSETSLLSGSPLLTLAN